VKKSRKEASNEDINEAGNFELQSVVGREGILRIREGILTISECQIT